MSDVERAALSALLGICKHAMTNSTGLTVFGFWQPSVMFSPGDAARFNWLL